jgi:hypothetical protein
MNISPEADMPVGRLVNPLAGWQNDDLLNGHEIRKQMADSDPLLFRVLDWPELRRAFVQHDRPASENKRTSRRLGLIALAGAGLGIALLGIVPALPHAAEATISFIALLLMTAGGLLSVLHWTFLRSKYAWLGHRYWTERLRQLYFQSLVNSLDLTAAAMREDAALEQLLRQRRIWLQEFHVTPPDPRPRIRAIIEDRTENKTWLRPEWRTFELPSTPSDVLAPLLDALFRQRIHIQAYYAQLNLGSDVFSPGTRAKLLHGVSDLSAILVLIAAGLGWLALLVGNLGVSALTLTAIVALFSALGLVARAADQGMQNEADADRYEWYAEAVEEVQTEFSEATLEKRILALRRLEELSYQELRSFLRTHNAARFTM